MKLSITRIISVLVLMISSAVIGYPYQIEMKPEGYFEGPGFAFLVYQNDYLVGKRGGLQMFLHGKRVLDAGEVIGLSPSGQSLDFNFKDIGNRVVDYKKGLSIISGKIKPVNINYNLICRTDGKSIILTVELNDVVDWSKISSLLLKLEVFPMEYRYKTYRGGETTGYFPERYMGKEVLISDAKEIFIAPEDPLKSIVITSNNAALSLIDGRARENINGFMIFAALSPHSSKKQFSVKVTPKIDFDWRREPIIQVSQVGYHPSQKKMAVIELDSRIINIKEARLHSLERDGTKTLVKSEKPEKWGPLFNYNYYIFDFTDVKKPGQYYIEYGQSQAGPISIDQDVYKEIWQPTMDVFFPVQMCHVEVRQGEKVWHGACHLDDGIQAPPHTVHFDSYKQKAETETPFKANEHIPGLDWGGWHDAGDNDLPFGSICQTVLWMALAQEEFNTSRDMTTINRNQKRVNLFRPDGKNDMIQQISFGMEFLISLYRVAGHICPGIIENNILDYIVVGDTVNVTDGLLYDPALKPYENKQGRSGKFDDRWVFTNRNTGGQYQFAQVAAISSRVLRKYDDKLAAECLKIAEEVWDYEQTHDPVHFDVCYQPLEDGYHTWEIIATAELFMSTGYEQYREKLFTFMPSIRAMPPMTFWKHSGFTLIRTLQKIENSEFKKTVIDKAREMNTLMKKEFSKSPYSVFFNFKVWGNNWDVLDLSARSYFFIKNLPEIFKEESLL